MHAYIEKSDDFESAICQFFCQIFLAINFVVGQSVLSEYFPQAFNILGIFEPPLVPEQCFHLQVRFAGSHDLLNARLGYEQIVLLPKVSLTDHGPSQKNGV